jgi:hypothetical protein
MEFDSGVSTFTCCTRLSQFQRVTAVGTAGRLELEQPFNPPIDCPSIALLAVDGVVEPIQFEICDQFGLQAESFSRAILDDSPVSTPISDALANMRVIDALVRSGDRRACTSVADRSG